MRPKLELGNIFDLDSCVAASRDPGTLADWPSPISGKVPSRHILKVSKMLRLFKKMKISQASVGIILAKVASLHLPAASYMSICATGGALIKLCLLKSSAFTH